MISPMDKEEEVFWSFMRQPDTTPELALRTLVALALGGKTFAKELVDLLIEQRREIQIENKTDHPGIYAEPGDAYKGT